MSTSRHPIALRLERRVGGDTRLLATVMCLPLVDGIFAALVVAGALTVPFGIVETGLLIFGGSATVAVVLAEMDGTVREQATTILALGAVLLPAAALEAALAPTIWALVDDAVFHRFAGLVILAVAAKTASAQVGEYLPRPAVIIGLGLVASFQPTGVEVVFAADPWLIARGVAAAAVGVGFALAVALLGPRLRGAVDLDMFRFGSSVALGMLALSVWGLIPTEAPVALGVLCVTAVFSYDPGATAESDGSDSTDAGSASPGSGVDLPAEAPGVPLPDDSAVADGGDREPPAEAERTASDEDGPDEPSRAPWL
jgi:hypothetical protein